MQRRNFLYALLAAIGLSRFIPKPEPELKLYYTQSGPTIVGWSEPDGSLHQEVYWHGYLPIVKLNVSDNLRFMRKRFKKTELVEGVYRLPE